MRAIETKPTWQPLLLTSILPQLRHYRRLKIIATFAVAGSLESVLEAATAAICRHVMRQRWKKQWRALEKQEKGEKSRREKVRKSLL